MFIYINLRCLIISLIFEINEHSLLCTDVLTTTVETTVLTPTTRLVSTTDTTYSFSNNENMTSLPWSCDFGSAVPHMCNMEQVQNDGFDMVVSQGGNDNGTSVLFCFKFYTQ